MKSILEQFCGHLLFGSLGAVGTDLFYAQLPTAWDPAKLVTICLPTVGQPSLEPLGIDFFKIQVTTRCKTWTQAWDQAVAIWVHLNKTGPFVWGAAPNQSLVQWISATSPPFSLGLDENHAFRVVCNYQLELKSI